MLDGNVRVFCLTNARLNFTEQASYFVSNRFQCLRGAAFCAQGSVLFCSLGLGE